MGEGCEAMVWTLFIKHGDTRGVYEGADMSSDEPDLYRSSRYRAM